MLVSNYVVERTLLYSVGISYLSDYVVLGGSVMKARTPVSWGSQCQTILLLTSAADRAALAKLPAFDWFDVAHAPIARPSYRCERLEAAGLLERRVVNAGITGESLWRKTQYRRKPGIDCA